jgi:hypothetical protein
MNFVLDGRRPLAASRSCVSGPAEVFIELEGVNDFDSSGAYAVGQILAIGYVIAIAPGGGWADCRRTERG